MLEILPVTETCSLVFNDLETSRVGRMMASFAREIAPVGSNCM